MLGKKRRRYTDAKFKVITPPDGYRMNRWWEGWYIDWRIALVGAVLGGLGALRGLIG